MENLVFGWATVRIETVVREAAHLEVMVSPLSESAACPLCEHSSVRVHSSYQRSLQDSPCCGQVLRLRLLVRRFFCGNVACRRKVFAERWPEIMRPYARRTLRHNAALTTLGLAHGGEAGQRTAKALGYQVSAATLLRRVRAVPDPQVGAVRVLGVDDFALRRGQLYGTILVDEERHCPIDVLPDREAATLAHWLQKHPAVAVITRDRAVAYAEGARAGAPQAKQVADRFHLLKNLQETIQRVLTSKQAALRETARALLNAPGTPAPVATEALPPSPVLNSAAAGTVSERHRLARVERFEEVRRLHGSGLSIRGIVRQTGLHRETVRKFLRAEAFPERATRVPRSSVVRPFAEYLKQRWQAGCENARQLYRELKARGYQGGADAVSRWVRPWREKASPQAAKGERCPVMVTPSPRQAAWWLLKADEENKPDEQAFIQELMHRERDIRTVRQLAQTFQQIVRQRLEPQLDTWRAEVRAHAVPELKRFADGLMADEAAVREALRSEWSNGQVEGQVNRLKLIKRQMFGRAKFDLLRLRVLYAP